MEAELKVFDGLHDVHVVFDIGARTDSPYDRQGIVVHKFEPNPEFAKHLTGVVNNFGLSDKEEILPYDPVTQSFCTIGEEHIMLQLRTLDWYAKDIPVDFIKIDAEGYDYKILLGGKETLKKVRYIQFEYWSGVRKFVDLLNDFDLSLILDDRLYNDVIKPRTVGIKKYEGIMVPLEEDVIDLIDRTCIPLGAGGNIFGIKRKV